jgi:transposase
MAVKRHKRNGKVYLAEYKNTRIGKKVKSEFIRYLGPEEPTQKKPKITKRTLDKIRLSNTLRAGDVSVLLKLAQEIDLVNTIDRFCCEESDIEGPSPGKLLTMWAINRIIDPESCTQLEKWIQTTILPASFGIEPISCSKNAFLSALDFICYQDRDTNGIVDNSNVINDTLYRNWRKISLLPHDRKENVAYDLSSILFFGVSCPLAEFGHNTDDINRKQINLGLVVSDHDKFPLMNFVYSGSRNDKSTMKNLIVSLNDSTIEPGTLIFDRGNVSMDIINEIERSKWKILCGIPKTSNAIRKLIEETDIEIDPTTYAHRGKTGHLYAVKTRATVFGKERGLVVYVNPSKRVMKIDQLNEELSFIVEELDRLSDTGKNWSEKRLHKEIAKIVGDMKQYVITNVKRVASEKRIEWHYVRPELRRVSDTECKWVILATDGSLKAKDIVKRYVEKDFIEKVFRTMKGLEEIEPVRHRLEHRVRSYMFICVLAYRLLSMLQWKIQESAEKESSWERAEKLLDRLGRVERVEIGFGKEIKTSFLNLSKKDEEALKKLHMEKLFEDSVRVNM